MRQATWISSALVVASMTLAGPAFAVSSAKATLSGFGYVLFDLNPNDGIDPALTVTGSTTYSHASVYSEPKVCCGGQQDYDSDSASGIWSPTSATAMLTGAHANATTGNNGAAAEGYASGPSHTARHDFFASPEVWVDFTLTPWTFVTFTVFVDASASTTGVTPNEYAYVSLLSQVTVARDHGGENFFTTGLACANSCYEGAPQTGSFVGALSLGYANPYDVAVSGKLYTRALLVGSSPVPEPQIYAMLLAGLAAVGFAVARRRAALH